MQIKKIVYFYTYWTEKKWMWYNTKCCQWCKELGILLHNWLENKLFWLYCEMVAQYIVKLNMCINSGPVAPHLREILSEFHKGISTRISIVVFYVFPESWRHAYQVPILLGIDKQHKYWMLTVRYYGAIRYNSWGKFTKRSMSENLNILNILWIL